MHVRRAFSRWLTAIPVLLAAVTAGAQTLPPAEVRVTAGYSKVYLDEPGFIALGGSFSQPFARRLAIEPEIVWMGGSSYSVWALSANVVVDMSHRCVRACPYFIAGPVWQHVTEPGGYSLNKAVFQAGVGWRVRLEKGTALRAETRLGLGALPRITGSASWELPRRTP